MSSAKKQSLLFRGIYEFEDPSGVLLAAKVPVNGTVDLYDGTALVVKPSQCAIFVYQGKVADVLFSGSHQLKTQNVPILTRLANWKLGFESPLRCELIFVSGHTLTGRRWGTQQPVLVNLEQLGPVPVRSFGNFNISISNPTLFYTKLMGTRSSFSVTDLEDYVQGQIVELLPEVFSNIKTINQLGQSNNALSQKLEVMLNEEIKDYGLKVEKIQILSALPSQEVIEALDAKSAIALIGSQKEYLLYKAANSLMNPKDGTTNDPMQMMMGLMLGKGLIGADYKEKEAVLASAHMYCQSCGHKHEAAANFCAKCGKKA